MKVVDELNCLYAKKEICVTLLDKTLDVLVKVASSGSPPPDHLETQADQNEVYVLLVWRKNLICLMVGHEDIILTTPENRTDETKISAYTESISLEDLAFISF